MSKLVFLNIETTGEATYWDNIAQLSYLICDADLNIIKAKNFYFNIGYIDENATKKNGLSKENLNQLSNGKKFKDFSDELLNDLQDAKIVCYNSEICRAFLYTDFNDIGVKVDLDENFFSLKEAYRRLFCLKEHSYSRMSLKEIKHYLNTTDKEIKEFAHTQFKHFKSCNNSYKKVASLYLFYKEYVKVDIEKLEEEYEKRRLEYLANIKEDEIPF